MASFYVWKLSYKQIENINSFKAFKTIKKSFARDNCDHGSFIMKWNNSQHDNADNDNAPEETSWFSLKEKRFVDLSQILIKIAIFMYG